MPAKHLLISGLVQGVFFRANSQKKAQELDLVGWIKNTKDSRVETIIQGDMAKVEEFIRWCQYDAPGKVTKIKERKIPMDDRFESFDILY